MSNQVNNSPADFIVPLNMNGLQGRMLRLKSDRPGRKEFLIVYGQRSSIERWIGIAEFLNRYGSVTMPDLPGFGGMDNLFQINQKPTLDNLADYLAAFVKMNYKRRRVTIVGIGYGFIIATRMLQRFPDLEQKTDLIISLDGIAHRDDLQLKRRSLIFFQITTRLISYRFVSFFIKMLTMNTTALKTIYTESAKANRRIKDKSVEKTKNNLSLEIWLWQNNDFRSYITTLLSICKLDNCRQSLRVPLWHIYDTNSRYVDAVSTEQHLQIIYSDFNSITINDQKIKPIFVTNPKLAARYFPGKIRQVLSKA